MSSSFTVNNGLEKPAAGDQEGQWGGTLNTNFDIIDRVLSGVGSVALSGTTHTLTTSDGALSDGQFKVINFTGALGANNTITISPNDQDKLYFIINSTTDSGSSGPYSIIISQGSGANVTIPNGGFDIVIADGAGSGAAVTSLLSKKITTGQLTTTGNVLIPDAGTIGSASDPDAISISSGGVVDFTQVPTFPNDTIETNDIQDNAVTLDKLASLDRGKIIVGNASGDPSALALGSNGQVLQSDGSDLVFGAVSASGGMVKNYIINPEFAYSQRGISINSTTPSSGSNSDSIAIIDMYRILSDGNDIVDIAQTQTDVPTGSRTAIELDVETANKKFGIVQFIENVNCESIIGQEVTLSFQAKATSNLDDVRAAIIAWDGTEDAPTADIINSWEAEGTNPTLVSNFTYENTPADLNVTTSFAKYSVTATIDTSGTNNVAIFIWSNVTGTTAGTDKLHIGQVQLEKGGTASDFVFPEFSEVVNSCRRYLHFMVANGTSTIQDNGVIANGHFFTTAARVARPLTTPMRVAPTITGSGLGYLGPSSGTLTGFASVLTNGKNITMMNFNVTYATNSATFNGSSGFITVSSGFFIMTAELGA
jgi:hypothetical protein